MRESQIMRNQIDTIGSAAELLMAAHMNLSKFALSDTYASYTSESTVETLQSLLVECERLRPLVDTIRASTEALIGSVGVAAATVDRERAIWERAVREKEAYSTLKETDTLNSNDYTDGEYTGGFTSKEDWERYALSQKRDVETGETLEEMAGKIGEVCGK
jgi:hypothetical protein